MCNDINEKLCSDLHSINGHLQKVHKNSVLKSPLPVFLYNCTSYL